MMLIFLLFTVVSGYDEQSLMQQEVSVDAEARDAAWQHGVQVLSEAVKEIPYPGKMRQMAIDALMQSVTKKAHPDAYVEGKLNDVLQLIDDLLAHWVSNRVADDALLAGLVPSFTACNTNGASNVDTHATQLTTAETDHETKRATELTARTTRETECSELTTIWDDIVGTNTACDALEGLKVSHVSVTMVHEAKENWKNDGKTTNAQHPLNFVGDNLAPNPLPAGKTNSDYYWNAGVTYWTTHRDAFDTRKGDCQTAIENWNTAKVDANTAQDTYESRYCQHRIAYNSHCTTKTNCFATEQGAYDTELAACETRSDTRVAFARVLARVRCLIKNLQIEPDRLHDLDLCKNESSAPNWVLDEPPLRHNEPTIPAMIPCTAITGAIPGAGNGFEDEHYVTINTNYAALYSSDIQAPATVWVVSTDSQGTCDPA